MRKHAAMFTQQISLLILYVVLDGSERNTIPIFVEHDDNDHLTTGIFGWPEGTAGKTYTIELKPGLSIEFDKHFPIRPASLGLYDDFNQEAYTPLSNLFGEGLAQSLLNASQLGFLIIYLSLTETQRMNIAILQIGSASTPPRLKGACVTFINSRNPIPPLPKAGDTA